MTYMQSNLAFADGIQELSFDEIEFVSGGIPDNSGPTGDAFDIPRRQLEIGILGGNGSIPPPSRPAPSVPPTTSSPVGPQIPVSRSTTVGGGTITTPYRPPAPAVRIVIKF